MAALLYVRDVANYFRQLTDDPDLGFLSDALASSWLAIGHDHYYQFVTDSDPERHTTSLAVSLANAIEYDLNGVVLGPAALGPRLLQLSRVTRLDSTGRPVSYLRPVSSQEELASWDARGPKVLLQGTKLRFSAELTGDFSVDYVPVPNVDWGKTAPADSEWIDDLLPWHDMIALFAALQYRASDNAPNEEIAQLLQVRQQQFMAHLQRGRAVNASRFVHDEDPWC